MIIIYKFKHVKFIVTQNEQYKNVVEIIPRSNPRVTIEHSISFQPE